MASGKSILKIGIILTGDYNWTGGLYYSLNIIKLLQQISLTSPLKIVVLINNNTDKSLIEQIRLANVEIVNIENKSFLYKLFCKLIGSITKTNYRFIKDINSLNLDILYPLIHYDVIHHKLNCKVYYWMFDFQHKFLPELFSPEEIIFRDQNFKAISEHAERIVLSSHDSKSHFLKFYPLSRARLDVYDFVSLLDFDSITTKTPEKFNIKEKYHIVCNQFWSHKNHMTVLKALKHLKDMNVKTHVVFTGKFDSSLTKTYVDVLLEFIKNNELNYYVTFVGFLSREDQLGLMMNSESVIQPSLFEGWSTVIEDAKALNKFILASSLSIHKEQLKSKFSLFEPKDHIQLANYIKDSKDLRQNTEVSNYQSNIDDCVSKLQKIFQI